MSTGLGIEKCSGFRSTPRRGLRHDIEEETKEMQGPGHEAP